MEQFLRDIFGDALTPERRLCIFTTPEKGCRFFSGVSQAAQYASTRIQTQNVYFGVGLIAGTPKGRGNSQEVCTIGGLWADIDITGASHKRTDLPKNIDEARSILEKLPFVPSLLVDSGHGLHAYWLFREPWVFGSEEERLTAAKLAMGWHDLVCRQAESFGWHLERLGDLARVLRLPGTLNHNGTVTPVRLLESKPHRYSPDDFEPFVSEEDLSTALPVSVTASPDAQPVLEKMLQAAASSPKFLETWNRQRADLADQSQSGYDLALASIAVRLGWTDQEIADLIVAHRQRHGEKPEKALRADYMQRTLSKARQGAPEEEAGDVDLSGILGEGKEDEPAENALEDPGPVPEELLRVPGFVSEVMDHCLQTAPYPNTVMAFCGALSLQAFLAGRKVCDPGDNRTNLYLLGLAHSAAGKDWPRKVNTRILHQVGLSDSLGERFASGEGVQDALFGKPCMLFQTDEIDGILQSINKAKDARHENVMSTLLTMYSAANSVFPMRRKAGKESPGSIDQPCLVIFGTAIPNHYYEALSERMLTNGFFARMLILESRPRPGGQEPRLIEIPSRIIATAKWWADFKPGTGNLEHWHPVPLVVEHSEEARRLVIETRQQADSEYAQAEAKSDAVGTTVWGRVSEQIRKLSLLYAVSENHESPCISLAAVQWASDFVMHQTRRMLFMASQHVADGDFDALIKRAIGHLRQWHDKHGPESLMPAWELRRRLKQRPGDFKDIVFELAERQIARFDTEKGTTKPKSGYRLI